jgi:hypothetical protein
MQVSFFITFKSPRTKHSNPSDRGVAADTPRLTAVQTSTNGAAASAVAAIEYGSATELGSEL